MKHERNDYSHLAELIECLARDNGWREFGDQIWDWPEGLDLEELEQQASLLSTVDKEVFACGEHFEVRNMVKQNKLEKLDAFLGEVFDGEFQGNFLKEK